MGRIQLVGEPLECVGRSTEFLVAPRKNRARSRVMAGCPKKLGWLKTTDLAKSFKFKFHTGCLSTLLMMTVQLDEAYELLHFPLLMKAHVGPTWSANE